MKNYFDNHCSVGANGHSPLLPTLQKSTPAPLHPCTPAPLHPCTPAPLHPCTPAPLHPCTPAPYESNYSTT
ncbi:hypothetical protein [[Phormidium] sp. ETS-05]|uniref:hypothetical protein n=1 Tax=[Phormidium] sp. ETS-05 TaxID=222819 RepID=UPI0018EF33FB|nr:hypothetical protein [[Phormidium] sp. ETS-05]